MAFEHELEIAVTATREASALLRMMFNEVRSVTLKGVSDLVTDADHASEALLAERLLGAFPDDEFFGEEGSNRAATRGRRRWLVDPIDGTTNYAHGYPIFAVSVALEVDDVVELGVVAMPMLDELYVARRGAGATLNGRALRVSEVERLTDAVVGTGFAYNLELRRANLAAWALFVERSQAARRDGAAAFDLCCVAAGRFDGFWEHALSPWDVAAGALIATEAGAALTNYQGETFDLYSGEVVASNGLIHAELLATIAEAGERPNS